MTKKINKIQNLIIFLILALISTYFIFLNPLAISDELWNFQNIYKMCRGLTIYKDANVIITPIFFYIGFALFKIFGATMLTFRFYNIVISCLLFYLIYKTLKNLKISRSLIIVFLTLTFELTFQRIGAGANYNILVCIPILIGMNLYISKKSNNILQGIITFIVFFTKQTTGVLYAISIVLYELYLNKFSKKFILDQIKKFPVFAVLSLTILLPMLIKGNLVDFINYAFGGILEFGENNIKVLAFEYYPLFPIIATSLYIFTVVKKKFFLEKVFNQDQFNILTLLFIFSIAMTFSIIPIMNAAHFIMAMPFNLLVIFYFFDVIFLEEVFADEKYVSKAKWISIIILFIILIRIIFYIAFSMSYITFISDKNSHFKDVFVYTYIYENSNELQNYILEQNEKGKEVVILSGEAAYTMVELKQNHGEYDLLFNGNMGYNGVERVKNDIINKKNTEFLIYTNEEDMFWQEPQEIREFIKENLTKKGEISNYTIYSNE